VLPEAQSLAGELGVAISPLSPSEPWLQANASPAGRDFGDAELARLGSLGLNLRWLDLAGTGVTDAGLGFVEGMTNLVRLHLERTAITDAGLARLAALGQLEYLNLYGTGVTDDALPHLRPLPRLRQLYLWQTQVTPEAARALAEARLDQAGIQRLQQEIEQLQTRIRESRFTVELAATNLAVASTNSAGLNNLCPVSGKPVDLAKTSTFEGRRVAFCCDNCKAEFDKDPKPFLARLGPSPAKSEPASDSKP
jgi:YHS domain-containing protein